MILQTGFVSVAKDSYLVLLCQRAPLLFKNTFGSHTFSQDDTFFKINVDTVVYFEFLEF